MTTNRIERLTREALGTHAPANPGVDKTASYAAAPALLIAAVTAVLLLSGCALNPEQPDQTNAVNPTGVGQAYVMGKTLFTVP